MEKVVVLGDDRGELARLREHVGEVLAGCAPEVIADGKLVTDELACQAMLTAVAPRMVRLRRDLRRERLRIEILADHPRSRVLPADRVYDPRSASLIGRVVLEQFCACWGVHVFHDHEFVWAEIALT